MYNTFDRKPERRSLGRYKHRFEDNIKTDIKEIGLESEDCIHLTQDRDGWWTLVNTVLNLWIP
jgi:hypothetical protein